jgi:hypothetical protein
VFDEQQLTRVLVAGPWCTHQDQSERPSIAQAMDVLRREHAELPVFLGPQMHIAEAVRSYGDLSGEDSRSHLPKQSISLHRKLAREYRMTQFVGTMSSFISLFSYSLRSSIIILINFLNYFPSFALFKICYILPCDHDRALGVGARGRPTDRRHNLAG